jgi:hypothetical protein
MENRVIGIIFKNCDKIIKLSSLKTKSCLTTYTQLYFAHFGVIPICTDPFAQTYIIQTQNKTIGTCQIPNGSS